MMPLAMPPRSRMKLPPIDLGKETVGQRLARLRKERGFTQVELAERVGIIQVLVSDYERDRIRVHAEMIARLARALGISADELLGLKNSPASNRKLPKRVLRRIELIGRLPAHHQRALLRTIDTFLKGAMSS